MLDQNTASKLLERYIRARYPVITLVSHEENRVNKAIDRIALALEYKVVTWSFTTGLVFSDGSAVNGDSSMTKDPSMALEAVRNLVETQLENGDYGKSLYVFYDIHGFMGAAGGNANPVMVRLIRDISNLFENSKNSLIFVSPTFKVPSDLEKTVTVIDWPLPGEAELSMIVSRCENDLPAGIPVTLNGSRELVVQALAGLTEFEASTVLLSAVVAARELSEAVIPLIVQEKAQIIRKSGVLEYYDQTVTMSEVGGLENLKKYAAATRSAFTTGAKAAGVDTPKGVLLVGVPGTGKSLSAKAIAGGKMPLLRMDIGALMGSLVGESEGNMRSALKVAEAVAPAVLWVDEIEKALGGLGEKDGGTSMRVFGTLLTWMQETNSPVYVVATANDVRSLKPELLRRFDDIFWVDLPARADRAQILAVHLGKRGKVLSVDEISPVLDATHGFTGAEIEKVVKSAVKNAFFDQAEFSAAYLLEAAQNVVPISSTMDEQIKELRNWSNNRALPAAAPLEGKPVKTAADNRPMIEL